MYKNNRYKTGYQIQLIFKISLHNKDLELLSQIQDYFPPLPPNPLGGWGGVGNIKKHGDTTMEYCVKSSKDLSKIISHFDKYPLLTQKQADFELFKKAFKLFKNKEHLTGDGFKEILSIRATMNLGLPEELKIAFPNIIPALRPVVIAKNIKDPNWVAGFVSGDGTFIISIFNRDIKTRSAVRLMFKITQHSRDEALLKSLVNSLGCGRYYAASSSYNHGEFVVSNLSDVTGKIIPFFDKYPPPLPPNPLGGWGGGGGWWCESPRFFRF
jgi:hypothetical protein